MSNKVRSRPFLLNRSSVNYGGVTPPPFTPASIAGLQLWLDASDAATISQTAGAVSQWNDKSGNSRNFIQATGARQPLYTSGTFPFIQFSTAVSSDVLTNDTLLGLQEMTIFSINTFASSASFGNTVISQGGEADMGWQFRGHTLSNPQWTVKGTTGSDNGDYSSPVAVDTKYIFANTYSNSASTRNAWLNGAAQLAYTGDIGPIPYNTSQLAVGGNAGGGTGNLNGNVHEIIVYNSKLSNADINRIGNYLASKWGVTWTNI